MTSNGSATECFVYITLPGQTQAVTAGRFVLTADRRRLALGRFVYGKSYLARHDAVAIDPIELKLSDETYETARLDGVFGALRDSGPDYWGRRVIEKHAGKAQLGELDYLLESPDDRAGALGFGLGKRRPPRCGSSTRRWNWRSSKRSPKVLSVMKNPSRAKKPRRCRS